MMDVHQIADEVFAREGGYGAGPASAHRAVDWVRSRPEAGRDDKAGSRSVRQLSRVEAKQIIVRYYFHEVGIGLLPASIQASLFDMYAGCGSSAVKVLQRLLTDMGHPVAIDGVIRPETVAAAEAAAAAADFSDAYGIARREYYYSVADRRPLSRRFVRQRDGGKGGWITRAEAFISPRLHLTEYQHRERTAAWL